MSKNRTTGDRSPKEHIADHLRTRIRGGELSAGDRLPTQQELVDEFGANRSAVRQALDVLRAEGLLTHTGRGAPPVVAEQHPHPDAPRPAGVELADRILDAFRADHVTIDTYSLTTETLNTALAAARLAIEAHELAPQSIRVRVLMPSLEAELAVPRLVSDPADPRPLERLRDLMRSYAHILWMDLTKLAERGLVGEVSVEVRSVRITPTSKYYLLNGTEALFGFYTVIPRTVPFHDDPMLIHDVLGLEATLFRYSSGPDSRDEQESAFAVAADQWFSSLWESVAVPVRLGE
ncbi:GntR family transcriptional regulator [Streptomyces sparsus]